MNFRLWIENIFGIEDELKYRPAKLPLKGPNDLPIERLSIELLMKYLSGMELGLKRGTCRFFSECQWGDTAGAIRVTITPKINVKIQRLHYDLEGEPVWLMKKYYFLDDNNFANKEKTVALEIFDEVKKIHKEELDKPSKNVKLDNLVHYLSSKLKTFTSINFASPHQVKKNADNEYSLYYSVRGGGSNDSSNIIEVVINISNNKKTGLIRSIVTVVSNYSSGDDGGRSWAMLPSDFSEYFMPSQGKKEITDSIITALRTY